MLRKRIIPVLLYDNGKLVKTIKFKHPKYIGDPINAVKIFNEREVDEIIILDITKDKKKKPDFEFIKKVATECFMPFGYGGGVRNLKTAKKILALGAEKIILNSELFNFDFIKEMIEDFGGQSVVISLDIKKTRMGKLFVFINNGSKNTKRNPFDLIKELEQLGVGEIIINDIDREGTYNGYNLELIKKLCSSTNIPIVALGGADSYQNFFEAIDNGASAAAAGSLFVYYGAKKAVLINYPNFRA